LAPMLLQPALTHKVDYNLGRKSRFLKVNPLNESWRGMHSGCPLVLYSNEAS